MNSRAVVVIAAVTLAGTLPMSGQECSHLTAKWDYSGMYAAAVSGSYAVFGIGSALAIADLSEPSQPVQIGEVRLQHSISDVTLYRGHACVATSGGLFVVDVANPADPVVVGQVPTPRSLSAVAATDGHAYVTEFFGALRIFDVSEPSRPVQVGSLRNWNTAPGVAAAGSMVYVAAGFHDGVRIIDASDPTTPVELGFYVTPGGCDDVVVDGGYAYVADRHEGFLILDVSDPSDPTAVGHSATPRFASRVALAGNTAFVVDDDLYALDVSSPGQPEVVGRLDLADTVVNSVAVTGQSAILPSLDLDTRRDLLVVADVEDPTAPTQVGTLQTTQGMVARLVEVSGSSAFVLDRNDQIRVFDVVDASGPEWIGSWQSPWPVGEIVAVRDSLYVAASVGGLRVVDVTDASAPVEAGALDAVFASRVALTGDIALVVDSEHDTLHAVDVSDPTAPMLLSTLYDGDSARGHLAAVATTGRYAIVTGTELHVIDVADPSDPVEVGSVEWFESSDEVAISGGTAYAISDDRVLIVDISDPERPEITGVVRPAPGFGSSLSRLAVQGGFLHVTANAAETPSLLLTYDLSEPFEPVLVDSFSSLDWLFGVAAASGRLYVAADDGGLLVADGSSCADTSPTARFSTWPRPPAVGESVQFHEAASGLPSSYRWDFGVGGSSSDSEPAHSFLESGPHTVSLTVGNQFGSDTHLHTVHVQPVVGELPPIDRPGQHVYVVPAAAHTSGAQDTRWKTDLVVHNPTAPQVTVTSYFLESGEDNSASLPRLVWPGGRTSLILDDLVGDWFWKTDATGAVVVAGDQRLLLTSHTFNDAADGSYGQFVPAFAVDPVKQVDSPTRLLHLTETEQFRTNVGFANLNGESAWVTVRVVRADGEPIGERTVRLQPYGHRQLNGLIARISDGPVEDAWAEVTADRSAVFVYGSRVDNRTGDPTFIAPSPTLDDVAFIPAAAHLPGAHGTVWRTDLELCSVGSEVVTLDIGWLRRDRDNTTHPERSLGIPTASCVSLEDVVDTLFGARGAGALRIETHTGAIAAGSRTFNLTADGTYGQSIPASSEAQATPAGQEVRLIQLGHSPDPDRGPRTNLGILNATDQTITVRVDLYRGDGSHLGGDHHAVPPLSTVQLNDVFRSVTDRPLEGAWATMVCDTTGGRFFGYASVADNVTGDPIYIPAQAW